MSDLENQCREDYSDFGDSDSEENMIVREKVKNKKTKSNTKLSKKTSKKITKKSSKKSSAKSSGKSSAKSSKKISDESDENNKSDDSNESNNVEDTKKKISKPTLGEMVESLSEISKKNPRIAQIVDNFKNENDTVNSLKKILEDAKKRLAKYKIPVRKAYFAEYPDKKPKRKGNNTIGSIYPVTKNLMKILTDEYFVDDSKIYLTDFLKKTNKFNPEDKIPVISPSDLTAMCMGYEKKSSGEKKKTINLIIDEDDEKNPIKLIFGEYIEIFHDLDEKYKPGVILNKKSNVDIDIEELTRPQLFSFSTALLKYLQQKEANEKKNIESDSQ